MVEKIQTKDVKDARDPKDLKDLKDTKEAKELKEFKDPSELKESKDSREQRALKEGEVKEASDAENTPLAPAPSAGPWRSYKEILAQLASRVVEAQKPIRVLQAIRWDNQIEQQFVKSKYRELPNVGQAYYEANDLGFDPKSKMEEFESIAQDISRFLGKSDALGGILARTALEYRDTIKMLSSRGTPHFYKYGRKLYGSPKDTFPDGKSTVRDLGHMMYEILSNADEHHRGPEFERTLSAEYAASELNHRFETYFGDDAVRVQVDDDIVSDAAAGSDYVKVRSGARFSQRDIDMLEVHEGWVHVATSLNGQLQPVARWLSKGPPRTTCVQEGLAALVEIFTFRTYPRRAKRLNDRILAVDKAEDGANFIEVFEWYRTEGYDEEECYSNTVRVFRGGMVEGGAPFTKDACYCRGVVLNYAFIQNAIARNRSHLIPFLFVGKVAHEDVPILAARQADGVIKAPKFLPPMFRDLNGPAIWMAYSAFFSLIKGKELSEYYSKLFSLS